MWMILIKITGNSEKIKLDTKLYQKQYKRSCYSLLQYEKQVELWALQVFTCVGMGFSGS